MVGCPATAPDYTNQCSLNIGEIYTVPHHCTALGAAGQGFRTSACQALSAGSDEWESYDQSGSCTYAAINTPSECTACCGLIGFKTRCRRRGFNGAEFQCCVQNLDGNPDDTTRCFTGSGKAYTCAPEYRGYTRGGCRTGFLTWAFAPTGFPPTDPTPTNAYPPGSWTNRWRYDTDAVVLSLQTNYQIGTRIDESVTPEVSAAALTYVQQMMTRLFEKYYSVGLQITDPDMPGYSPFQERILQLSNMFPAGARPYLSNTLCINKTREDISTRETRELLKFCGCNLQLDQYQTTANLIGGVDIPCDPVCNTANTVPLTDGAGRALRCTKGVCIIDNVSLDIIDSTVRGDITINQLCSNCEQGCNCVISDLDINTDGSIVGGKINVNQDCENVSCYTTDQYGYPQEVNCEDDPDKKEEEADRKGEIANRFRQAVEDKPFIKWSFVAIGVLLVIILIIALFHMIKSDS